MKTMDLDAMDRLAAREEERLTAGMDALHGMDPSEALMFAEEDEAAQRLMRERHALQCEIFHGLLDYLFADGPGPIEVRERMEGLLRAFAPTMLPAMTGPTEWADPEAVRDVLRRKAPEARRMMEVAAGRGELSRWVIVLEREEDELTVARTLAELIRYLMSEGARWKAMVAVAYCMAKALRPELIYGMSLEDVARLSGDQGGRATPSARIRRLYNARLTAAGLFASTASFQKGEAACRKYAEAQRGNTNRKMTRRGRSAGRGA